MLNTISWPQYFAAIFILTAAWYAYVFLRFRKPTVKPVGSPMPPITMTPVIGAIKPDEGDPVEPETLIFQVSTPDEISDQTIPRGPADDFLDEAQTLADAAETKCEFLSLLEILVLKYEHDQLDLNSLYQQLVVPYAIDGDEWPLTQKISA